MTHTETAEQLLHYMRKYSQLLSDYNKLQDEYAELHSQAHELLEQGNELTELAQHQKQTIENIINLHNRLN